MELTGIGPGGSGGLAQDRVRNTVLPGIGHLIPMEAVNDTAELAAKWIGEALQTWRRDEELLNSSRGNGHVREVDDEWLKHIGKPTKQRNAQKL